MVDREVVRRRLREVDRRVAALRAIRGGNREDYLDDPHRQASTERHLQVALQAVIDIALHILADDTGHTPEDYGSAFLLLARAGIVPVPLGERLRLAAGLRNVLVRAYVDVDAGQVWEHLGDMDDLVDFAGHIESYLRGEQAGNE